VLNENLNWTDAGLGCQSLDEHAHLLVINEATEQSAIAAMLDATDRQFLLQFLQHFNIIYR